MLKRGEAILLVSFVAIVTGLAIGCSWYKASVQADVYRRQGVEMGTWEVMMGAKPVERPITIR